MARVVSFILNCAWDKFWTPSTIIHSWIQWEASQILLIQGSGRWICCLRNINYSDSSKNIQILIVWLCCASTVETFYDSAACFFQNLTPTRSLFPRLKVSIYRKFGSNSLWRPRKLTLIWSSYQVILFHCKQYMQQTFIK